jgi:chromosome condensin MukBEF ATPase and DNA-binding subunit MukB
MKPSKPGKFRRIILVNWLDLPYAQIDLDDSVTIFEGGNGSGKSTVLLAALVTLMPDKKQLRSRKVTIEKHVEEAIYHRLQPDEPIAYAALEIQLANEVILAGVHITKQRESNSIALDVFTIRRWPDRENLQDFFRVTEGDREWTCNLNELKQRAGEWGVELHAHPTLIAYFRELYDLGVIPLAMATDLERSQYAHLLETSMAGGMSASLVDRLKNYLLPEYEKLPDASRLMHDNLLSCIETQNELNSSSEQYTKIADLFRDLNAYVTARGLRISREKDAANEKLRLTETNLETTVGSLQQLELEKVELTVKKEKHDAARKAAVSNLQASLAEKRTEEQRLKDQWGVLTGNRDELKIQLQPINSSRDELDEAISGLQQLHLEISGDPTGKETEVRIKTETERIQEEFRQLKELQRVSEAEQAALKEYQGASPDLVKLAEKLDGTPILHRYADLTDLNEAAQLEAKLGPIVHGLIVKDTAKAAGQIAKLDPGVAEVWLTASKDPANAIVSEKMGNFQRVDYAEASRLTRIPSRPVLGEAARKKRLQELDLQIKSARKESAELEAVVRKLDGLSKHANRIADEFASKPLSWLKSETASLQKQIKHLDSQIARISKELVEVETEITAVTGRFQAVTESFVAPEEVLNAALSRNATAFAIKDPLRIRLEKERVDGIALFTKLQAIWESISGLAELSKLPGGELPDIGAALERLRTAIKQVDKNGKVLETIPEGVTDDMTQAAAELLHIRSTVRSLIQTIQPHNLTDSNEPEVVIQALTQKISTLTGRLDEQQLVFRNNIDTIADSIHSEINKRTQRILRWSNDLKEVSFGTVKGIRLRLERIPEQLQILDGLRLQKELFSKNPKDPKTALQEFWKLRTGQELTTENALDYRRFVNLLIEVGDGQGKWRLVGGSTGEMTGAALSILIILLRAWEEEAALRERVDPLRLLFLDEAARLDPSSHATLEALSTGLAIQLVVAAPIVAASGKFTHYVLSRKQVGSRRQVIIRGRRRFCAPDHENSIA